MNFTVFLSIGSPQTSRIALNILISSFPYGSEALGEFSIIRAFFLWVGCTQAGLIALKLFFLYVRSPKIATINFKENLDFIFLYSLQSLCDFNSLKILFPSGQESLYRHYRLKNLRLCQFHLFPLRWGSLGRFNRHKILFHLNQIPYINMIALEFSTFMTLTF